VKTLFLRWALTTMVVVAVVAVALYLRFEQLNTLTVVGKIAIALILGVYVIGSSFAAVISWKTDKQIELGHDRESLLALRYQAEAVRFAAHVSPYCGLMGAVAGIAYLMGGSLGSINDAAHIKEAIAISMAGTGTALYPTLCGILFMIVLQWEHYLISHEIGRVVKDYEEG